MKSYLLYLLLIGWFAISQSGISQESKNLAEKLGYPKDSKLLIIHADDLGLSHSTNVATIKAFESNNITSGSVMMPCPWISEIADYAKTHPGLDVGIHLTLTSEWKYYKWGGILGTGKTPSLTNPFGFLYASSEEVGKTAKPEEVEMELKAQIDKAFAMGIPLTHLDNHMGSLLSNPELIKIYFKLAKKYGLPILIPSMYLGYMPPAIATLLGPDIVKVDNLFMLTPEITSEKWGDPYQKFIASMKPGLNEIIVHLSLDNDEMQAIAGGIAAYGSAWRQKDLDYVSSEDFKKTLQENNIVLIHWKQIRDVMAKK